MDITAANSVVMISIANLYPVAQKLQQFSADAAFATADVAPAEAGKGVDGYMYAGYTPYNVVQTYTIMPDSPSRSMFEQWLSAMNASRGLLIASGIISIPSIKSKYTMVRGVLTRARPIANAQKVLQALEYEVTWDRADPAPF
jgi:hypothetical protein